MCGRVGKKEESQRQQAKDDCLAGWQNMIKEAEAKGDVMEGPDMNRMFKNGY